MSVANPTLLPTATSLSSAAPQSSWKATVPVVLFVAAALCLFIDMPVARYCLEAKFPKVLVDLLKNAEAYGHSAGVTLIILTVWFVDPHGRSRAITAALCSTAGGLAANVIKLCVGRIRPQSLELATVDLTATFTGLFRFAAGGSAHQSFPSAHTATAIGLAIALSAAYPRGRVWFFVMAALVGLQRIQTSAHYPSDVLAGAAIGWIAAQLVLTSRQPRLISA